ncbi:hypothetical protein [Microvirga sp. TS319]|uniref:hypothetical protein n=1 Tax=Microvirga sp. TS319 TaxID=3241165 RepID=UPI00351A0848
MLVTLALVPGETAVKAKIGPSVLQRSCFANRELVLRRGAVVLDTGPVTCERFVRTGSECAIEQYSEPVWVPSADNPQCPVGFRCRDGHR